MRTTFGLLRRNRRLGTCVLLHSGHGELANSLEAVEAAIRRRSAHRIYTCAVFVSPVESW